MSETTVCQLLKDLERTIHERIEGIVQYAQNYTSVQTNTQLSQMASRIDSLEKEILKLRETKSYAPAPDSSNTVIMPPLIMPHPLTGIEVIPKREIVLVDPTPERINEADRLLLNSSARKALEQEEDNVHEEEVLAEVMEEFDQEEQEEEQEQEEQEEEQEGCVEENEEEEEGGDLEEFEYKGSTYYRDTDKNVYMTNEDGEFIHIGMWSDVKNRVIVKKADS